MAIWILLVVAYFIIGLFFASEHDVLAIFWPLLVPLEAWWWLEQRKERSR